MKLQTFYLKKHTNSIRKFFNLRIIYLKNVLINVREFFWPLLEKKSSPNNDEIDSIQLNISNDNLDLAFQLKTRIIEQEEDRRKGIESKATLFISTISLASSIVLAASALVINTKTHDSRILVNISVSLSFIVTIYAVRTVWFAVKALERKTYSVLGINDINFSGTKEEYQKHLIKCLMKIKSYNQNAINSKVDNVTMAQEYYKRAIATICMYSFIILLFSLLK